ncbi:hypothetical protein [Paractinoplanes durhamensis]|nr:hypothetical protein [Actinoplanes durhamensis]
MNQLLYPIDGAPDLSDATAARLVDNMIDGQVYSTVVADFAAAIDQVLRDGALHPQTAAISGRYSEAELLEFLRRVAQRLAERKPWPPPLFTKLDVAEWPSFGDATVLGRIDRPMHAVKGAIKHQFDAVPAGDGKLPVLILQLRTGEAVAVMGSVDPRATSFVLLYRGQDDPAEVLAHFRELTRFRPGDIVAV